MCSSSSSMVDEEKAAEKPAQKSETMSCVISEGISIVVENPVTKSLELENPLTEFGNLEENLRGSNVENIESDEVLGMRENPFDALTEFGECSDVVVSQVTKTLEIEGIAVKEGNLGVLSTINDDDDDNLLAKTLGEIPETVKLGNLVSECHGLGGTVGGGSSEIHDEQVAKTLDKIAENTNSGSIISDCCELGGIMNVSSEIDDVQAAETLEESAQFVKTVNEFTGDVVAESGDAELRVTAQECDAEDGEKVEKVRSDENLRSSGVGETLENLTGLSSDSNVDVDENEGADDSEARLHIDEIIENSNFFGSADLGTSSDEKGFRSDGAVGPLRQYWPKHCEGDECMEHEQFRRRCDCGRCPDSAANYDEERGMMGYRNPYFDGYDNPYFYNLHMNHPLIPQLYRNGDRFDYRRKDYRMSKQEHTLRMSSDPLYRHYWKTKGRYHRPYHYDGDGEGPPFTNPHFMNRQDGFGERESRWDRRRPLERSEPEEYPVGAGLSNLGYTCYLNAVIQCFTHTVPLVEGLLSLKHEPSSHGKDEFCVLCAVRQQVEGSLTSSGKIIFPYNLVDNLSQISSDFRRHQQEDAHEFLQCLLDKLDTHWFTHEVNAQEASSSHDSLVKQIFGGRLVSQLRCSKCGHSSDSYEPVNNLSLEIEDVDDVESAFKSFTKVENLEDFKCGNCNEKVLVEKQLLLDQGPSVAALHLKRFKSDGIRTEKIDRTVKYPLEIDLNPYTSTASEDNDALKYELYAFVMHIGLSSTLGHYFCYIRTSPDEWYRFDDSKVTKVSESHALDQEAYILFYARKGSPRFGALLKKWQACLKEKLNASPKSVLDSTNNPSTTSADPGPTLNDCKDLDTTELALVPYVEPLSCLKLDKVENEGPPTLTQESAEATTSSFPLLGEHVHNEVSVSKAEVTVQVSEGGNSGSDELETPSSTNVENPSVGEPEFDGANVGPCITPEPRSSDENNDKEEPASAAEQVAYQIKEKACLTTVKGRSGKAKRDLERKEAAKYVRLSGMPFGRRRVFMAPLSKKRRKQYCSTLKHSPKKRVKLSVKRPLPTVAAIV